MTVPPWQESAPLASLPPLIGVAGFLIVRSLPASSPWLAGVICMQVALIAWLFTGRLTVWRRLFVSVVVAGAALIALSNLNLRAAVVGSAIGGVCHLLAYSVLLTWFASSLLPGAEPVITSFARQMRKTMPTEVARYTRAVTAAWCVFFAAQLLISLLLATAASYAAWSAFVNVWNLPLIAIMAIGEYGVRSCLFPRGERTGFLATLAALREIRVFPGRLS